MSEIRTKLLSLGVLGLAFAGLSYGQTITCANTVPSNNAIRLEGETELVSDGGATCTTTGAATTGSVNVQMNLGVTSKAETSSATYAGNSDAILQILAPCAAVATATSPACGASPVGTLLPLIYVPGVVSGNSILFSGVSYPLGNFGLTVSNIRVNAAAAPAQQVTETIQVLYTTAGSLAAQIAPTLTAENVGVSLQSLGSPSYLQNGTNQNLFLNATSSSFGICNGLSSTSGVSGTTPPNPAYTLLFKEVYAGAFKTMTQENGTVTGTIGTVTTLGTATQATEIQVQFANLPSSAQLYLPITVTSGGTTFSLVGGVAAITSPSAYVNAPIGVNGPFSPSSTGTFTATYAVTAATSSGTTFSLPVYMSIGANSAAVQSTAMTVALSYAPSAAVTGPQATVPIFAPSTATPLNNFTLTACTTTLLFPYVTNVAGFETGIAIANTSTDNAKNIAFSPPTNGTNSQTSTPGICILNFYGNTATQPALFTTPVTIGPYNATSGQEPVYANTLSLMSGATNFSGYAIAVCNFNNAHGYAFVADGTLGQPNGLAEGYLALVTSGTSYNN